MAFMDGFYKGVGLERNFLEFLAGHRINYCAVLYAIAKHVEDGNIVSLKLCANKNAEYACIAKVDEIIKAINENDLILWSVGENDDFSNISLVGPCTGENGKKFLRSLNDDETSNNLEKLPEF